MILTKKYGKQLISKNKATVRGTTQDGPDADKYVILQRHDIDRVDHFKKK